MSSKWDNDLVARFRPRSNLKRWFLPGIFLELLAEKCEVQKVRMQIIKACASKLSAEEMLSKESSVKVQEDFMIRTKEKCQQSFLHAFHPTKDGPCVPNILILKRLFTFVGLLKILGYSSGTHELTWSAKKSKDFELQVELNRDHRSKKSPKSCFWTVIWKIKYF